MFSRIVVTTALVFGMTGVALAQGSCGHGNPTISCPAGQIWDGTTGRCQVLTVIG